MACGHPLCYSAKTTWVFQTDLSECQSSQVTAYVQRSREFPRLDTDGFTLKVIYFGKLEAAASAENSPPCMSVTSAVLCTKPGDCDRIFGGSK